MESLPTLFTWLTVTFLVATRLSVLFISAPVFGSVPIPMMARMVLVIGLSIAFVNSVHVAGAQIDIPWLLTAVASEVLVGAAIASALFIGFGAFHFAGRLLDLQIGYGIASLVDIATRNNAPLIGTVLSMLAVLIFFMVDGHLAMLRMIQFSFIKIPLGVGITNIDLSILIAFFGACFSLGFSVVAPVVICLLLIDIGMAFMSRTMPQMNVFVISLALKVFVGVALLALVVPLSMDVMKAVFNAIFDTWYRMLG